MVKQEIVVKLKVPIEQGTEKIHELVLRRPKARDFRGLPMEPSLGHVLDLAGDLSGQAPSVIDELDVEDMMEVVGVLEKFMPGGQETGGKRSA